jgi:TatA/E family protein of Tat protein translocase
MPDTVLILVVALLMFGPKKLPQMARTIGKSMEEFRRAARDIENELMKEPEPTTPPPPPLAPAAETPALTEGTPESEHHYGETGEEYPGHEAESAAATATPAAPLVIADAPVTLPSATAPAVAAAAEPAPAAVAPVHEAPAVTAAPAGLPLVTPPTAAPVPAAPVTAVPTPTPSATPAVLAAAAPAAAAPVHPPVEKKTDVNPAA